MARQYEGPPPMVIDENKRYIATIGTSAGDIVIELFADKAPRTVNNFVFLARDGYYDGVTFHRVIKGFMAQGATRRAPAPAVPATGSTTSSTRH